MKVIVAGSRTITDINVVRKAMRDSGFFKGCSELVNGGCDTGVDITALLLFRRLRPDIPVRIMEAEWARLGRKAGPLRNRAMAEYADALVLVWDGRSKGSASMRDEMLMVGKPVFEVVVRDKEKADG